MTKSRLIEEYLHILRCPNDASGLEYISAEGLKCLTCGSEFPIHAPNLVELLPREPFSPALTTLNDYEKRFFSAYHQLFHQQFSFDKNAIAWGAVERIEARHAKRKRRQIGQIISGLDVRNKIACDISGGAGWLTLRLAKEAKLMINCDLSCDNLNYVYNKSTNDNILFVRLDFFAPPFQNNSVDTIVCTDTLIYGDLMVKKFLTNIHNCMKTEGGSVVDFYNRSHRNPFHKPYMIGYTLREVKAILHQLGITEFTHEGFFQEWKGYLQWLIPCTRHIIAFRK